MTFSFEILIGTVALSVILILIGYHLGRKSRQYIPPPPQYHIPENGAEYIEEPEGDLFNDALREDGEERIDTLNAP